MSDHRCRCGAYTSGHPLARCRCCEGLVCEACQQYWFALGPYCRECRLAIRIGVANTLAELGFPPARPPLKIIRCGECGESSEVAENWTHGECEHCGLMIGDPVPLLQEPEPSPNHETSGPSTRSQLPCGRRARAGRRHERG